MVQKNRNEDCSKTYILVVNETGAVFIVVVVVALVAVEAVVFDVVVAVVEVAVLIGPLPCS